MQAASPESQGLLQLVCKRPYSWLGLLLTFTASQCFQPLLRTHTLRGRSIHHPLTLLSHSLLFPTPIPWEGHPRSCTAMSLWLLGAAAPAHECHSPLPHHHTPPPLHPTNRSSLNPSLPGTQRCKHSF